MTQTLGSRIRELREGRGLSRSDLARNSGVTFAAVYQWEERNREPRREVLNAVAEALGVSASYLVSGKDEEPVKRTRKVEKGKTDMPELLRDAQERFASAMGLPSHRIRVTVEVIIGPKGGTVSRRITTK